MSSRRVLDAAGHVALQVLQPPEARLRRLPRERRQGFRCHEVLLLNAELRRSLADAKKGKRPPNLLFGGFHGLVGLIAALKVQFLFHLEVNDALSRGDASRRISARLYSYSPKSQTARLPNEPPPHLPGTVQATPTAVEGSLQDQPALTLRCALTSLTYHCVQWKSRCSKSTVCTPLAHTFVEVEVEAHLAA